MRRHARGMAVGVLLALPLAFLAISAGRGDEDDDKAIKEAQEAIVKMAKANNGDAEKQAAELAKKAELINVMQVFKPRNKKGLGWNAKGEGIETKIIAMAKRPLSKGDLGTQEEDLIKMAEVTRAVAEVAYHFTPKVKKADKDPADWKKYN